MKRLAAIVLVLSIYVLSGIGLAQERFPTGFYSPTGSNQFEITTGWLESGCGSGEPYTFNYYHTGVDDNSVSSESPGDPVYAIWDGVVVHVSSGGWGVDNVALVVKSKLHGGQEFLWLVGHVRTNLGKNDTVSRGKPIATVGPWTGGDHLHFGLIPGTTLPRADSSQHIGLGRMGCEHWPDALTFLSTFGTDLEWDPAWELRSASLSFTTNRAVRMYHATSKSNPARRFLAFWDPDRNQWNGWLMASGSLGAPSRDLQGKQDILDRSLSDARFVGRPNTNGFVDPIEWLTTYAPDDALNTQAWNDITKRALSDSRFVGNGPNFTVNVNWDPAWELRSRDFAFVGGRMVTIWHLTNKGDNSIRYTAFSDPDRGNAWTGWLKAQ